MKKTTAAVDFLTDLFRWKRSSAEKLLAYGFQRQERGYIYRRQLRESGFLLTVTVTESGTVRAKIIDPALGEPYTLHLAKNATGAFVGAVRAEYEETLREIADKCFIPDVFRWEQSKGLLDYVRKTYGAEPEHLWEKFPENAIWRRQDNRKWYGVMMIIPAEKLGISGKNSLEILDVRMKPEELDRLADDKRYFRGYHMNKKHWGTVVLDGSIPWEELCRRIDESYRLAKK